MSEESLPERIGPYVIERRIGAGGMGTVFLGTHSESNQRAAIKVLNASMGQDEGIIERFAREIETMSRLGGPHIVNVYSSGSDPVTGLLYYSMEYVEGQTVTDFIRARKRVPWDEAIDITLQVCSALRVAHAAGVVHRDLKPSNLLLASDGVVKLTDFGVAQVFAADRLTITGGIVGTIEYMSPEQAEGRRATKKSDLYSLGAVMYAMVTGRPPFTGTSAVDVIRKHATARFDLPSLYQPEMPRLLEEVVCKLLSKNPDDRYGDAHIVSLRLKEVLQRVALARKEAGETIARPLANVEAPTAMVSSHASSKEFAETRDAVPHGPGPATLMRDLFQREVENERRRSPHSQFFDHIGVLTTLLLLLLLSLGWWLSSPGSVSSTDDADAANPSEAAQNEVARIMRLAQSYRRAGDSAREEQTLMSLRVLITGTETESDTVKKIDSRLSQLREHRREQSANYRLARKSIERAKKLLEEGSTEEAQRILQAVVTLYEHDRGAREFVDAARAMLER